MNTEKTNERLEGLENIAWEKYLGKKTHQLNQARRVYGNLQNIRESDEFWKQYQNPLEPMFKIFYDHFLKINQQEDGLESYNRMVELLIAYDAKYVIN